MPVAAQASEVRETDAAGLGVRSEIERSVFHSVARGSPGNVGEGDTAASCWRVLAGRRCTTPKEKEKETDSSMPARSKEATRSYSAIARCLENALFVGP